MQAGPLIKTHGPRWPVASDGGSAASGSGQAPRSQGGYSVTNPLGSHALSTGTHITSAQIPSGPPAASPPPRLSTPPPPPPNPSPSSQDTCIGLGLYWKTCTAKPAPNQSIPSEADISMELCMCVYWRVHVSVHARTHTRACAYVYCAACTKSFTGAIMTRSFRESLVHYDGTRL